MKVIADLMFCVCGVLFMNIFSGIVVYGIFTQTEMSQIMKWLCSIMVLIIYNFVWLFISYISAIDGGV